VARDQRVDLGAARRDAANETLGVIVGVGPFGEERYGVDATDVCRVQDLDGGHPSGAPGHLSP
jgi:hypothetical protein